jgi:hypothetical protein
MTNIDSINIEKALDYMRDNAPALAKAKADRVFLEQFRKTQKAMLVNAAPDDYKTIQARESYAYAHEDYIEVLEGLKVAVEEEEKLKWHMQAASLKVEVWRSQEATNRGIDRAHR